MHSHAGFVPEAAHSTRKPARLSTMVSFGLSVERESSQGDARDQCRLRIFSTNDIG